MSRLVAYIDASFTIHSDDKEHSGLVIMCGHVAIMTLCCKQKIATKDSIEEEMVTLSDYIKHVEWCQGHLKKRVFKLEDPVVYNDNQSTIRIIENGKVKPLRNRHLTARCGVLNEFFDEYKYAKLRYKKTGEMIADMSTKPLLGALYWQFSRDITGCSKFPKIDP